MIYQYRVTVRSLAEFAAKYVACRKVTKLKSMPQQQVLNLCGELGILPFHFKEQDLIPKDTFLPRDRLRILGVDDFVLIDKTEAA